MSIIMLYLILVVLISLHLHPLFLLRDLPPAATDLHHQLNLHLHLHRHSHHHHHHIHEKLQINQSSSSILTSNPRRLELDAQRKPSFSTPRRRAISNVAEPTGSFASSSSSFIPISKTTSSFRSSSQEDVDLDYNSTPIASPPSGNDIYSNEYPADENGEEDSYGSSAPPTSSAVVRTDGNNVYHNSGAGFRLSRASMDARFYNATRLIIVDQSGFGHFRTIQAAVNSIPINNTHIYTILVAGGLFEEKVVFPHNKPFIRLQGLGSDQTTISWHDTAATAASQKFGPGRPLGTFHSATVAVNGANFIARGLTFQNTAPAPDGGMTGGQAVALQVSGDQVAFYDCKFRGKQDTLYDHRGRHYFRNCYIEGSIDFIFGDGLSLYRECQVYSVGSGFITAQKRQNLSDDTGFSFVGCNITGSNQDIDVYLGRAWGPFSRVIYASCYMDANIDPNGWHNWGDSSKERTVYYGEFNCTGPGSETLGRVSWSHQLNESEAAPFADISFVQGDEWLPYE